MNKTEKISETESPRRKGNASLLLDSDVVECLCHISRSPSSSTDEAVAKEVGAAEGIVGLTCPIDNKEPKATKTNSIHQPKVVKIFTRMAYVDLLSTKKPEAAVVQALQRFISEHELSSTPCFFWIRRPTPSNTPKWIFVVWVPKVFLDSDYATFQIAQVRNLILRSLSSTYNIVQSLCRNSSEIEMLRQVIACDTSDLVVQTLLGSQSVDHLLGDMGNFIIPRSDLERYKLLTTFGCLDEFQEPHSYLRCLPMSLSNGLKDLLHRFFQEEFDAIVMVIDDTTSTVQPGGTLKFQSPADLVAAFDPNQPKYYLVSYSDHYFLILHIPDKRDMVLRFLYSLFKTTITLQIEQFLDIRISKSADLRQGDSIDAIFEEGMSPRLRLDNKMSLVADITARPRPQVSRRSLDPFGLVKSVVKWDGKVEYVTVDAATRFKF